LEITRNAGENLSVYRLINIMEKLKEKIDIHMIKKLVPLILIVLCCIIIGYWAVSLTLKVDKLRDDVNGLSGLLTGKIIDNIKK